MKTLLRSFAIVPLGALSLFAMTPKAEETPKAVALQVPTAEPHAQLFPAGALPPILSASDLEAVWRLPFAELPPPEYMRPTTVDVTVIDIEDEVTLRLRCKWAPRKAGEGALAGCAFPMANSCLIYIGPETDRASVGVPRNAVLAHEVGHCNGWPGDHPGARSTLVAQAPPLVVAQVAPAPRRHAPEDAYRHQHYGPPPVYYYPPPGVLYEPSTGRAVACLPTLLSLGFVRFCL